MPNRNDHILWLVSAWPNRISPFNGDFIMRHAQAASAFVRIHVISVVRDTEGLVTRSVLKEEKQTDSLTATVIYYYCPKGLFPLFSRIRSTLLYRSHFRSSIEDDISKNGVPDFVHVHWGMKAGIAALWIKRKWKVPYYVTEHWTGFLPEATDRFDRQPAVIQRTWKRVLYGSSGCQVVSETMAKAMRKLFPRIPVHVIPNVVDTSVFFPRAAVVHPHRFIHISGLDDFKDPEYLFAAFQLLLVKIPDAELIIYGSQEKKMKALAEKLRVGAHVSFHAEVPQFQLAEAICTANALLLYSRYETFGCVLIEANACGIPVIVTDIPVFQEKVTDGHNGILVPPGDPSALADAMLRVIRERDTFNAQLMVQETATHYAYPVVGRLIADSYKKIPEKN